MVTTTSFPVALCRGPGDRRAGTIGLWIVGIASKPFEGVTVFLCWLIVGIADLGILCVFLQPWRDVKWLARHVVRIGLLGTLGLIVAFSAEGRRLSGSERSKTDDRGRGRRHVCLAFFDAPGHHHELWLKINLRLLGHFDG